MQFDSPEFYPTPRDLARRMLSPYAAAITNGEIKTILDPSAGKGDLLRAAAGHARRRYDHSVGAESPIVRLYACELNEALAASLAGATWGAVRLLGRDFLEYSGRHQFDLIVMNPPFSVAADHLAHAWKVLSPGGALVCVFPTTTLDRPTVAERTLLAEVEKHGTVERIGAAFAKAERPTDVDVALITMKKPKEDAAFNFSGVGGGASQPRAFDSLDDLHTQLARPDTIGNLCLAFDRGSEALGQLVTAWRRAEFWLDAMDVALKDMKPEEALGGRDVGSAANELIDELQRIAWQKVVSRTTVGDLFTAKMHQTFDAFMAGQGAMDFNADNIKRLGQTLLDSKASIAQQCIDDVFEKLCSYDKKNKVHFEGWKTNSAYKVNRKAILPGFIRFEWGKFDITYHREYSALDDIDKAMCHVAGKAFADVATIRKTLKQAFQDGTYPDPVDSEFFKLRWFKKGTLHLEFLDRFVWERFNITAAKGRGWIGAD